MNYEIHYLTEYAYDSPVSDNLNALRVHPATTSSQRCDEFHVRLEPEARLQRHVDYYGTQVLEFGIAKPHDHLTVDVRARVVTSEPKQAPEASWEALLSESYIEVAGEFLLPLGDEPVTLNHQLVDDMRGATPLATAHNLSNIIADRFRYEPGATYVGSTVDDFLGLGAGVCQDFAHLGVVLLRRNGIAARYVSGYLFSTAGGQDDAAESVEVQTHAWVEGLLPGDEENPEPVWVGIDPTNRKLAGETHVKIGHGRRYSDVPPTKGVYFGSAGAALTVAVTMTRLDAATSART
ncbi:MAG: transglutaminase family protein [Solirubrobacteraceae bacterium]|nr:transglutaminase family protein [Solirubrobacteraceae bacterium]